MVVPRGVVLAAHPVGVLVVHLAGALGVHREAAADSVGVDSEGRAGALADRGDFEDAAEAGANRPPPTLVSQIRSQLKALYNIFS